MNFITLKFKKPLIKKLGNLTLGQVFRLMPELYLNILYQEFITSDIDAAM